MHQSTRSIGMVRMIAFVQYLDRSPPAPDAHPQPMRSFGISLAHPPPMRIPTQRRYSQPYERVEFRTVEGSALGRLSMGGRFLNTALRRELVGPNEPPHLAGLIMREHLQQIMKDALPEDVIQLDKCLGMFYLWTDTAAQE